MSYCLSLKQWDNTIFRGYFELYSSKNEETTRDMFTVKYYKVANMKSFPESLLKAPEETNQKFSQLPRYDGDIISFVMPEGLTVKITQGVLEK